MKNDMPVTLLALGSPLHDARVVAAISVKRGNLTCNVLAEVPLPIMISRQ